MYQQHSFFADALGYDCLPQVIRDYRIETICESAFSASLKEMALADMGIAWLARDIIDEELGSGRLAVLCRRTRRDRARYRAALPRRARLARVVQRDCAQAGLA